MSVNEIKQAILKAWDNIPQEEIEIAGEKVVVRGLTEYYLEQYRQWKNSRDELQHCSANSKLVQLSLHDKDGNRIFGDDEVNQINGALGTRIDEVVDVILRINGLNTVGADAILKNLRKILGDSGLRELHESIGVLLLSLSKDTPPTSSESSTS